MPHFHRQHRSAFSRLAVAFPCVAFVSSLIVPGVATAQQADAEVLAGRFIREVIDPYARIDQYAGTIVMERGIHVVLPDGQAAPEAGTTEITLEFHRNTSLRMVGELSELRFASGTVSMYVPIYQTYASQAAEWNDLYTLLGQQSYLLEWHPLAAALMGIKPPLPYLNPDAFTMLSVTAGSGDAPTVWTGTVELMPSLPPASATWHTNASNGRLQKIHVDLQELLRVALAADPSLEGATVEHAFASWTFADATAPPTPVAMWPTIATEGWDQVDLSLLIYSESEPSHPLVGQMAPDFTGPTLDGHQVTLSQLRGKVVILDFWATWCGPCIESMPLLDQLHQDWKHRGVVVLGVNVDDARARRMVDRFRATHQITFDSVLDPQGAISRKYTVEGIPALFVIDTQGVIQQAHMGFSPHIYTDLHKLLPSMVAPAQP